MEESNQRKCRTCGEMKTRTLDGKFASGNKRWCDETGLLWSGNYCPSCNKLRAKDTMNKFRKDREVIFNGTERTDS